ncbi:39183_t:CDS:2, partial [Gigaspora margarita]
DYRKLVEMEKAVQRRSLEESDRETLIGNDDGRYLGPVKNDDSDDQFDPGGLCCRHGIGFEKPYENWKERVIEFVRQVDDNLSKNKNEEIVAEKVLKFDATSGQALQGSVTIEAEQKDEPPKLDVMNIKTLKRPRDNMKR